MKKTNEKLAYDCLLEEEKSLKRQLRKIEEEKVKVLPEKVKQIYKLVREQGRTSFTDEEFEIVVLLKTWRRSSGRKDHC